MFHPDYTIDLQVIDHKQTFLHRNDQIAYRVWCAKPFLLHKLSSTWSLFTSVTRSAGAYLFFSFFTGS